SVVPEGTHRHGNIRDLATGPPFEEKPHTRSGRGGAHLPAGDPGNRVRPPFLALPRAVQPVARGGASRAAICRDLQRDDAQLSGTHGRVEQLITQRSLVQIQPPQPSTGGEGGQERALALAVDAHFVEFLLGEAHRRLWIRGLCAVFVLLPPE